MLVSCELLCSGGDPRPQWGIKQGALMHAEACLTMDLPAVFCRLANTGWEVRGNDRDASLVVCLLNCYGTWVGFEGADTSAPGYHIETQVSAHKLLPGAA